MSDHITFAHDHCTIAEDDHHERERERERESLIEKSSNIYQDSIIKIELFHRPKREIKFKSHKQKKVNKREVD